MALLNVTDDSFTEQVENSDQPVLVDFWAAWCGPCQRMNPIIEEFEKEHGSKIKVAKVNVDDSPATAAKYQILSIPTMYLFEGGEVKKQLVGMLSKDKLEEALSDWA